MTSNLTARLAEAVELALAGHWQRAHEIVQDHEDDRRASWIHALVHRVEGDLDNARYWYHRAGQALREERPVRSELEEIRAELGR